MFTEALRLPDHERAAYLERAHSGDVELHRAAEALLQEQSQAGDFLKTPPQRALDQNANRKLGRRKTL